MTIHCIFNRIRSGKTLFLTYMALVNYAKGQKIYSNYDIGIPYVKVHSLRDLEIMKRGFFAWDDAYRWANARLYKDMKGVDLIMSLSGKRHIDIAYTTTRPMQIDKNIRMNTEFAWVPSLLMKDDKPFRMIVKKYEFMPEGMDIYTQMGQLIDVMAVPEEILKIVCDVYDTEEEITELAT